MKINSTQIRTVQSLLWIGLLLCMTACTTKRPLTQKTTSPILQQQRIDLKNIPLSPILPLPVAGVSRQQLTDTWGAARSAGRRHEGVDIMAPRGTPVYSTTVGIVSGLQSNPLGGNVVWILGPSGSWHYYAHLDRHKRGLAVGDMVKAGDLIGYVGNSGNAKYTASHLHYGIYLQGKGRGAVNPFPYLHGDF